LRRFIESPQQLRRQDLRKPQHHSRVHVINLSLSLTLDLNNMGTVFSTLQIFFVTYELAK
jgi:hypothetical protein